MDRPLELDERGRVKKCVNCGHEHHYTENDAIYCMNCGYGLINKCTNTERRKVTSGSIISSALGFEASSTVPVCGRQLPPDANFCPYCGSESLFYRIKKSHEDEDVPF